MGLFNYDYTFCANSEHCPKKDKCKRAESIPGIHSYALFYNGTNKCDNFLAKKYKKERS